MSSSAVAGIEGDATGNCKLDIPVGFEDISGRERYREIERSIDSRYLLKLESYFSKSANADTISQQPQGKSNKKHKGKKRNKKKKNGSGPGVMDISRFVLDTCRRLKRTKVLPDMECSWLSRCPCSYRPSKRDTEEDDSNGDENDVDIMISLGT
ncbi:hypothetical protein LXL04_010272 [Taraxacum kok-saghyz]